jgi:hypothetical protein
MILSISTSHSSVQALILANLNVSCQSQLIITITIKRRKRIETKERLNEKKNNKKSKEKMKRIEASKMCKE